MTEETQNQGGEGLSPGEIAAQAGLRRGDARPRDGAYAAASFEQKVRRKQRKQAQMAATVAVVVIAVLVGASVGASAVKDSSDLVHQMALDARQSENARIADEMLGQMWQMFEYDAMNDAPQHMPRMAFP